MTEEFFAPELVHLLVLLPKSNWKTTWEAGLADWHLVTVKAPRVYAGAADKEQAQELYGFAAHFAECLPDLADRLTVRPSTKEIRKGNSEFDLFKVLASDDSKQKGKKQGKNATLGLLDELHAHENDNLFTDFRSAGFKRRNAERLAGNPLWHALGKLATISTAGYDRESALGRELVKFLGDPDHGIPPKGTVETRLRVLPDGSVERHPEGRLTIARYGKGRNVLLMWANREDDDVNDPAVVKLANPASTVTLDSIEDARESLTPWAFRRYRCNLWTLGFDSWLPQNSWDDLYAPWVPRVEHRTWEGATTDDDVERAPGEIAEPLPGFVAYVESLFPRGTEITGALDMARYRDTAAIVVMAHLQGPDYIVRKVPRAIVWRSGGHANPIRYDWPKAAIRLLNETYDLKAFALDEKWADQLGEEMEDEGVAIEQWSQSNERVAPADTELRAEILADPPQFAHDGDPILSAHIMAGKVKDIGPSLFKTVKQDGADPPPIDAQKAFAWANALDKFDYGSEPLAAWG
jgi:hypothetical protein